MTCNGVAAAGPDVDGPSPFEAWIGCSAQASVRLHGTRTIESGLEPDDALSCHRLQTRLRPALLCGNSGTGAEVRSGAAARAPIGPGAEPATAFLPRELPGHDVPHRRVTPTGPDSISCRLRL